MGYRDIISLALVGAFFLLSSCGHRLPDQVFHVCLGTGEIDETVVHTIQAAAEKHGLTFNDNSQVARTDTLGIGAGNATAPSGSRVFFDVQKDGRGILIGSNSGTRGEDLRLSFFDADSEAAIFKSDVIRILSSLPDARVLAVDPDSDGPSPC